MPLAAVDHPHSAIEPFLWGLLPENELVLQRWGASFHVSPRNVFGLIAHVAGRPGRNRALLLRFCTMAASKPMRS